MRSELREEIGIVGKGLNLQASSVDINSEELCSVTAEGDLFDLVGVDQSKEFGISDIGGSAARALDHHFDSRFGWRSSNLVDINVEGHVQCR